MTIRITCGDCGAALVYWAKTFDEKIVTMVCPSEDCGCKIDLIEEEES